jgi:hypothetical protein
MVENVILGTISIGGHIAIQMAATVGTTVMSPLLKWYK